MDTKLAFLVGAAIAMAGCTEPPVAQQPASEEPTSWNESGQVSLDEGVFAQFGFEGSEEATLTIEAAVEEGPSIDIFVMDDINFQSYEEGGSFSYAEECTVFVVKNHNGQCEVPAGEWYVILDNSVQGEASPPEDENNDVAVVTYALQAI